MATRDQRLLAAGLMVAAGALLGTGREAEAQQDGLSCVDYYNCTVTASGALPTGGAQVRNVTNPDSDSLGVFTYTINAVNLTSSDSSANPAIGFGGAGIVPTSYTTWSQTAGTTGPTLQVNNQGTITSTNASAMAIGGALLAMSFGAQGAAGGDHNAQNYFPYVGGTGGAVTVFHHGAINVTGSEIGWNNRPGLPAPITLTGLGAYSIGGTGTSYDTHNNCCGGSGGNGGAVSVTVGQEASIAINGRGLTAAAVQALSIGGQPSNTTIVGQPFSGVGGNGGSVNVDYGGTITNTGSSSFGILAGSIGGSGITTGGASTMSGAGGVVGVTVEGSAAINLQGGSGIGVFGFSAAGNLSSGYTGATSAAGNVSVTVNQGALISSTGGGQLGMGVLAISSGTASILDPLNTRSSVSTSGGGQSGTVTVSNGGTITTNGGMAIGIAALSVGGAAIVSGASGAGYLGNSGTEYGSQGAAVSVTNTGAITTQGSSAHGIMALSTGGGGLLWLTPDSNGVVTLGSNTAPAGSAGYVGHDAGAITVNNAANITTGAASGGGNAAIGILAQSIGGGGGSTGGNGTARFTGDAGGGGGSGGNVAVTNTGGQITTWNDGAIGVLAQSVGGGGGNGANAAGAFVAAGGQGGSGGNGGNVSVGLNTGSQGLTTAGDFAAGIVAQSIGGGGGNGGYAKSFGLFISDSIGGSGGTGGSGGSVTASASTAIATAGAQSAGIIAQSIGAGGGTAGAAQAYSLGIGISVSLATGGNGANAGSGGTVDVVNNSRITTAGTDSIGMLAQSIGGGGGSGGSATAKSAAVGTNQEYIPEVSISYSHGGGSGGGGSGGGITLTNGGQIFTSADGGHGMVAQSIGGGGGNGGDSTAGAFSLASKSHSLKMAVALGASGGAGGYGGNVSVANGPATGCTVGCYSQINTAGNYAVGMIAQSIGGGGGSSTMGAASTGTPNLGTDTGDAQSMSINFAAGGTAGGGGGGGTITVSQAIGNGIQTWGSGAHGMLVQSIGGGGGYAGGGSAAGSEDNFDINIAVGASGGNGGSGGQITVTNNGGIATGKTVTLANGATFTTGGDAAGIFVQSIGGGGGYAGSSDASASISSSSQSQNILNIPSSAAYSVNQSVGGSGGSGGSGGAVTVTNTGTISTRGIRAYGIVGQSIGGGGGAGGSATSTDNGSTNATFSAHVLVGGSGGSAGSGGGVTIYTGNSDGSRNPASAITTAGYAAHGIIAQSIGGGGGIGADGSANTSTNLALGSASDGQRGASGNGQTVLVTQGGTIQTAGDDAFGMLVQSIGGGGGWASAGCTNSGGANNAAAITGMTVTASACLGNIGVSASGAPAAWTGGLDLSLNVGGGAGASGNGGGVGITHDGVIVTTGARAFGIVAQSIGGGGGVAVGAAANITGTSAGSPTGASGGAGGTVGITLAAGSSITTFGAGAYGILAQSIGGGGGVAGDSSLAMVAPVANTIVRGDSGNDGNQVTITTAGGIATTGANAHGIFAQSIGGGGGLVAGCCNSTTASLLAGSAPEIRGVPSNQIQNAGSGGQVVITQTGGTISTAGPGSIGIFAQSTGTAGAKQGIAVTVGGSVTGGTGPGAAGIMLSGGLPGGTGGNNTITVNAGGTVGSAAGIAGMAIATGYGSTLVSNAGTITGSINLGSTPGGITNTGTLNTGPMLVTSNLANSGTVNVAGAGTIGTTALIGSFTQQPGGTLAIDVNSTAGGQTADLLTVTGGAAVGGTIAPRATALLPGAITVLNAGSLSSTATVPGTAAFTWSAMAAGNSLTLTPTASFAPAGTTLTAAQQTMAGYLQKAWGNSDASFATTFGSLSQQTSVSTYAGMLAQMSPLATQAQATAMSRQASSTLGSALSCPEFATSGVLLGEDACAWGRIGASRATQGSDGTGSGYRVDGVQYRFGAQRQVADNWFVSAALGYGESWARIGNGGTGNGQTYEGSLALKYVSGPWLLAGAIAGTSGSFHNNRYVGASTLLQSDPRADLYGGRLRAAYTLALGDWYLRPGADIDVMHLRARGFQEYGNSGAALNVRASSKTSVAFTPKVELGGRHDFAGGVIMRPYVSAGVSFAPNGDRTVQAGFVGASAQTGTFSTTIGAPRVLGLLDIGVQVYRDKGLEIRAEYNLQANDSYVSQTGSLRAAYHF